MKIDPNYGHHESCACLRPGDAMCNCGQIYDTPPAHGDGEGDDPFGDMPAPIGNPEAWPPNYADGYNDAVRNMVDSFPSVRARLTTRPTPEAQEARDADMFWDYDDNERCYDSIIELVSSRYDDSDASDGAVIRIQRAAKLPDMWVRLKLTAETVNHDSELDYEVIDAALALPAQGEGNNG